MHEIHETQTKHKHHGGASEACVFNVHCGFQIVHTGGRDGASTTVLVCLLRFDGGGSLTASPHSSLQVLVRDPFGHSLAGIRVNLEDKCITQDGHHSCSCSGDQESLSNGFIYLMCDIASDTTAAVFKVRTGPFVNIYIYIWQMLLSKATYKVHICLWRQQYRCGT